VTAAHRRGAIPLFRYPWATPRLMAGHSSSLGRPSGMRGYIQGATLMHKEGLDGWFNKNLRGKKGQQGFTLIELLVVVTILGVLAAIVTLSLVGLTTNAS